jgi:hypothetical protein
MHIPPVFWRPLPLGPFFDSERRWFEGTRKASVLDAARGPPWAEQALMHIPSLRRDKNQTRRSISGVVQEDLSSHLLLKITPARLRSDTTQNKCSPLSQFSTRIALLQMCTLINWDKWELAAGPNLRRDSLIAYQFVLSVGLFLVCFRYTSFA